MKTVLKFIFIFWGMLAILLVGSDILSYSQLLGDDDKLQLINRAANVTFGMWLIYPPLIIGWFILFVTWTDREPRTIEQLQKKIKQQHKDIEQRVDINVQLHKENRIFRDLNITLQDKLDELPKKNKLP